MTWRQDGQRLHWPASIHATNKLGCSDCHNPMAKFSANDLSKLFFAVRMAATRRFR